MKTLKTLLLFLLLTTATVHAENEGLWEGYDGEWSVVSRQLIALAEATPADKFSWRPGPGVRSMSEAYMHIAISNFYLLSVTGATDRANVSDSASPSSGLARPRFAMSSFDSMSN